MSHLKSERIFTKELADAFPEIKSEVLDEDYQDLIALQVGCLTRFIQAAIKAEDWKSVERCIAFVNENFDRVEFSVENSLAISYLGKLEFPGEGMAKKLLPKKLFEIRETLLEHYNSIHAQPQFTLKKKNKKEARYKRS